jgi:Mg-chelatase subunit ChlD
MSLRSWYGTSLRIPSYSSFHFPQFVASSVGIVRSVVQTRLSKEIRIVFNETNTASADQERGLININRKFLNGMFPDRIAPVHPDNCISALLGIIVHEAAHFAWTPLGFLNMCIEAVEKSGRAKLYRGLAAALGNIIEDIYIEAEVARSISSLSWMVEETNEIFFSAESFENAQLTALAVNEAPATRQGVLDAANLLIYAKTRTTAVTSPFLADLFAQVRSATELVQVEDRIALCVSVYNALLANLTEKETDEDREKGEKGEGEGVDMSDEDFEEGLGKVESNSEGITAPHTGAEGDKFTRDGRSVNETTVNQILKDSSSDIVTIESEGEDGSTHRHYIEKSMTEGETMPMDARYVRLAELGRQRASVNRPYGLDMNRGNNIRKLYRIGTDGKIFAQPVTMNNYKPMQVIILVDCSGSMVSGVRVNGEVMSRIEAAMRAAIGAAYGLTEARCEVAVYGHTADMDGAGSVRIYRGKSFSEPVDILSRRFSELLRNRYFAQNRDGNAVNYVGKKFTAVGKRRLLIVISDGEPAAANYHGNLAEQHTKRAVDEVRSRGVDVLSISITEDANRVNKRIYGESWNTYSEDPGVIEQIAKSLLG